MMTPEEFWNSFCPNETVEAFAARCEDGDIHRLVEEHVDALPHLYGVVCCLDWNHTFRNTPQYTRQEVVVGLIAHLEEHHSLWDKGTLPSPPRDYPSNCPRSFRRLPVDVILDQQKSFEETLRHFGEKEPTLPASLPLINVGVDMPEIKLPDE